jgi:hypothetical protein
MTRVANALHGRQMKVGTRRRRAPVADSSYRNYEEDSTVFCNVNTEPLW